MRSHNNNMKADTFCDEEMLINTAEEIVGTEHAQTFLLPRVDHPEARSLAEASLIFHLICVGFLSVATLFLMIPHAVSIAISLYMVKRNLVFEKKAVVISLSAVELLLFTIYFLQLTSVILTSFTPILKFYCFLQKLLPLVIWNHLSYIWMGSATIFGSLRLALCWRYKTQVLEEELLVCYTGNPKAHVWALRCLILHLLSFVLVIPHIVSIGISLHMVKKSFVIKRKGEVIALCVMELMAFAFLCSFGWVSELQCENSPTDPNYVCKSVWEGWIVIIFWGLFAIVFGIPRVVICWNYERIPVAPDFAPNQVIETDQPLLNPGKKDEARSLAVTCLILHLLSFSSGISQLFSVAISLHMVKRKYIVKRKIEVIILSLLETIGFALLWSFVRYYWHWCLSSSLLVKNESCYFEFLGWIAVVSFGIPRVVFCWKYDKSFRSFASSSRFSEKNLEQMHEDTVAWHNTDNLKLML